MILSCALHYEHSGHTWAPEAVFDRKFAPLEHGKSSDWGLHFVEAAAQVFSLHDCKRCLRAVLGRAYPYHPSQQRIFSN